MIKPELVQKVDGQCSKGCRLPTLIGRSFHISPDSPTLRVSDAAANRIKRGTKYPLFVPPSSFGSFYSPYVMAVLSYSPLKSGLHLLGYQGHTACP